MNIIPPPSRSRLMLADVEHDYFARMTLLLEEIAPRRFILEWAQTHAFAVNLMRRQPFELCLINVRLGHRSGIDLLAMMRARNYSAPVVLLASGEELEALPVSRGVECIDRDRLSAELLRQVLRDTLFKADPPVVPNAPPSDQTLRVVA